MDHRAGCCLAVADSGRRLVVQRLHRSNNKFLSVGKRCIASDQWLAGSSREQRRNGNFR
ncbi:MAG: hypothetical protein JNK57_06480 [Planctomycetaceae bacterium]|nr:hypothetical protein [Planctomycetaceae bacterium]